MLIAMEGSSPTIYGENNYQFYVWTIYQNTIQRNKIYIEGPAAASVDSSPVNIRKMADEATQFIAAHQDDPVYLVGWSRGAAACVQVAHDLLATGNRRVAAMFLFDPVDMDTSTSSNLNFIPRNVDNAYHAVATDKNLATRNIFPTTANSAADTVNFDSENFFATHGGIAGAGETDAGSWDWMYGHMVRHSVLGHN